MTGVTVLCFLASYVLVLLLESVRLLRRSPASHTAALLIGLAGLVAHTMYLLSRSEEAQLPPLLSSTHDWMLVLAWLAVVFYLFITAFDRELAVGVFLMPLVLILIGAAYFVSDMPNPRVAGDPELMRQEAVHHWAMLHATLLVFGIAGVVSGFVMSLMYVAQHRRLKHKQTLKEGLSLPSLETLARWNWWSVMVSVPLLTLGMLTGVGLGLYSRTGPNPVPFGDPVVVVSGVVWVVMLVFFVWLWRTERPIGKQVAWLTIWAFGFLLVTLIGVQVLAGKGPLETWHTSIEMSPESGVRSREMGDSSGRSIADCGLRIADSTSPYAVELSTLNSQLSTLRERP